MPNIVIIGAGSGFGSRLSIDILSRESLKDAWTRCAATCRAPSTVMAFPVELWPARIGKNCCPGQTAS